MVNSDTILDYYFDCGDFAMLVTGEMPVRVKIIGTQIFLGDKYYIVAGFKEQMVQAGWEGTPKELRSVEAPTGWVVDVADPDELELCPRAAHLSLI